MDPKVVAVIGLCAILALWYGAGHLYNRRRGQILFRWLEMGLDVLGGKREAGWLGSSASGARVNVIHAALPFRRLELTLLLENREIPLLWLLDHLRGRRDRLIIRATLRSPPRGEVEISATSPKSTYQRLLSRTQEEGAHGLIVAYQGPGAQQQAAMLRPWLESYGNALHRFIWSKTDPHIQLQAHARELVTTSSQEFLKGLQVALNSPMHLDNRN